MTPNPVNFKGRTPFPPALLVSAIWLGFFVALNLFVWRYGSSMPYADDMSMVGRFAKDDPVTAEWLWSQHVVHRLPLPRAVYMGIVSITRDLRWILFLDVWILGGISLAMILAARRLRGRTAYADAFFAGIWMHWGNVFNLLLPFAFTFILPVALSSIALLIFVLARGPLRWRSALLLGLAAFALPLCGGPGITQAPALALWMIVAGVQSLRSGAREQRVPGGILISFGVATGVLIGLYFVNFELSREPADFAMGIHAAVQFTTLSMGPVFNSWWPYTGVAVIGSLVLTGGLLVHAWRTRPAERLQILALVAYGGALVCMAGAVGLKSKVMLVGSSPRYIGLPTLFLCAGFLLWIRFAPARAANLFGIFWCTAILALQPIYVSYGRARAWRHTDSMSRFEEDARAGMPIRRLAKKYHVERHRTVDKLHVLLRRLKRAGFPPFDHPQEKPGRGRGPKAKSRSGS